MRHPNASLFIAFWRFNEYNNEAFGVVAHLGERVVRNDEVAGSIPVNSTIEKQKCSRTRPSSKNENFTPLHVNKIIRKGDLFCFIQKKESKTHGH